MSDASYVSRQKWLSIPQLKKTYPDVFGKMSPKEIQKALNFTPDDRYPVTHREYENDYPTHSNIHDFSSFVDNDKRRAKVVELYTRKTEDSWYVVSSECM